MLTNYLRSTGNPLGRCLPRLQRRSLLNLVSGVGLCLLLVWFFSPTPAVGQTSTLPLNLQPSPPEGDPTTSLAWGDFDQDGDLDLVVGNGNYNTFAPRDMREKLYCNNGGALQLCWESTDNDFTLSVAWGDYDRDNDLDLAVGNGAIPEFPPIPPFPEEIGAENLIYRNDGYDANGRPQFTIVWRSQEHDSTLDVGWADYDGDGYLDLAAVNGSRSIIGEVNVEQPLRLYCNRGGTLDTQACWSSAERYFGLGLSWGDVDNDGDPDLAVAVAGQDQLYCNENHLLTPCWHATEADTSTSVEWGDMNGDGFLDLAIGNGEVYSGQVNRVYCNRQGQLETTDCWHSDEADGTLSVVWGDVDNDGDLDLAAGNGNFSANQPVRVYCNEGQRLATSACWSAPHPDITSSVAWGDVDNDGDLDLMVGNTSYPGGQPNRLYRNDGYLLKPDNPWRSDDLNYARALAWADYDSDGDPDLLTGDFGAERLYRNEAGRLTPVGIEPLPVPDGIQSDTRSVAWGDWDGDHDQDLVLGNNGQNQLYRNDTAPADGTARFVLAYTFAEAYDTRSVAWSDYDGDGDLDLAVGNGTYDANDVPVGQPNFIYRNDGLQPDGTPSFTQVFTSVESESTHSLAWADVDNDGDPDLAVGNAGAVNRLYRNEGVRPSGEPIFIPVWAAFQNDETYSIAWGDVDNDGDPDLAVGNINQPSRVYCNQGGLLEATACWSSLVSERTRAVAWADYDSDGDLDLAAGYQDGQTRIFRNDLGHLTVDHAWIATDAAFVRAVAWADVDNDGDPDLVVGNSNNQPLLLYYNTQRTSAAGVQAPFVHLRHPGKTPAAAHFAQAEILTMTQAITIAYTLFGDANTLLTIVPEFSSNGLRWQPATPGAGGDGLSHLEAAPWPTGVAHTFVWAAQQDLIKSDTVRFRLRLQPVYTRSPILWTGMGSQTGEFRLAASRYIKVVNEVQNALAGAVVYANHERLGVTDPAGLLGVPAVLTSTLDLVALAEPFRYPTVRKGHDGWAYKVQTTSLTWDEAGEPHAHTATPTGEQRLQVRTQRPLILFNLVVALEWAADSGYLQRLANGFHLASDYLLDITDGQMAVGSVTIYNNHEYWDDADIQLAAANTIRPHAAIGGLFLQRPDAVIRLGRAWDGDSSNQGQWDEPNGYRTLIHEFAHYALGVYDEYYGYVLDAQGDFVNITYAPECIGAENRNPANAAFNASVMDYQYTSTELSDRGLPGLLWSDICATTAHYQLSARDHGQGESTWETLARGYADPQSPPRWQIVTPATLGKIITGPIDLPAGLPDWPTVRLVGLGREGTSYQLTVLGVDGAAYPNALVALFKQDGITVVEQGRTNAAGQLEIYGAVAGDTLRASSVDGGLANRVSIDTDLALVLTLAPTGIHDQPQAATAADGAFLAEPLGAQPQPLTGAAQMLFAADGNVRLQLNADALPGTAHALTIAQLRSAPAAIPPELTPLHNAYQLTLDGSTGPLLKPALLTFQADQIGPGLAPTGTTPSIYVWDSQRGQWQALPTTLDNEQQEATAVVTTLGVYLLMAPTSSAIPVQPVLFLPLVTR